MIRDLTGNQCRDLMTGVIMFHDHVSWYVWWVVLLYAEEVVDGEWVCLVNQSSELQLSSLEVTKEWTSCSVARGVSNSTIFPIMWIWWPHDLHSALTCCSILRWESNIIPRFFTWGFVETAQSPTFIVEMSIFFRRDVEQVMTKSVFSPFSWSLLATIHFSTLSIHFSSLAMAHAVSCVLKHIVVCHLHTYDSPVHISEWFT